MAIAMKCPSCRTAFDFPDELAGKRIKCKSCGEIFKIDVSGPKPAAKPAPKPAPASKSSPAVKPAAAKAPPPPKPKSGAAFADDDDDEDRPRSKRRAADDDEDDRPRSKRRTADDDEDEDAKPNRRKKWDEEDEDDAPRPAKKKKIHPLLIIGPILGVVAVGIIVVALVFFRGGKGKDLAEERTKGVGTVVTIEHPEKDVSQIVAADAGNQFGVFRKPEQHGKTWEIEPVDVTTGKSAGKHRIPELESPKYVAMSSDGKYVMVEQEAAFGRNDRALTIYDTASKAVLVPKWVPYPRKNIFDDPTLYKAEFIGNDKIVTINTKRAVNVWQLPDFSQVIEPKTLKSVGEPLTGWMDHGDEIKHERLVAFSADRKQVAIWTGDGYMVVNTADGEELVKFSTKAMNFTNVKAGPVAWRPDGKVLAMVFEHGNFGSASTVLVVWNPTAETAPVVHQLYASQFNQSKGINWWGNRYIATTGSSVEGILIDSQTGKAVRQLMAPPKKVFSFSRNGRLWYVATPERKDRPNVNDPANVVMVDSPDELIEKDPNPEAYEEVKDASKGLYLRRLWMEPDGVTRLPVSYDPPLKQRLIGQP